ncbi:MAG TPA: DUF362 domain-containing protein [Bacteroidales bacterium]|nr:DUF362 domain-containing protein [Bacteroidales bacterium]
MITEERLSKLPRWIKEFTMFLRKFRIPGKIIVISVSVLATIWFLLRVIPKPSRATYPCMQIAAPFMSGLVIWLLSLSGSVLAFRKARNRFIRGRYLSALLFLLVSAVAVVIYSSHSSVPASASSLDTWYKPNIPLGTARGIFPGRVAWGHNPKVASWDGTTGSWWDDKFNNQQENDRLFSQTIIALTGKKNEKEAWNAVFTYFNKTRRNSDKGYQKGEKIAIKINENNTSSHENTNEINANPQVILSLLASLVNAGGVPQENITVADPSRFITNNIFDKCHQAFPGVHFVDHNGGDGREKAEFVQNAIPYSVDNGKVSTSLAKCMVDANYIINLALMKGHVSQGVTLCGKNYFGCTGIETDWRKNAHSSGFSQNREGKRTYSVFADYMGHKDLGGKTMLFLVDGVYGNKFVDKVPAYKWALPPFNNQWPNSLFASQDGVAIDAVVLDFALAEWPDAPDMKYSDLYLEEMALADNPPSGTAYDPEKDGSKLASLGVTEHWNNPKDKQYTRNLATGNGIELVYKLVK